MSLTSLANSLKQALNRANLQSLTALFSILKLGDILRALPTRLWGKGGLVTSAYSPAGIQTLVLPDDAKCAILYSAYARAGTGTKGGLTLDGSGFATNTAPTVASHVAVTPSGDLMFLSADAWTSIDALYLPRKDDVYETTLTAASNAGTMPTGNGLIAALLEVESLAGTLVSKLIIDVPGTAPASGHAALSLDKLTINFNAGNAVTSFRVKYGTQPAADVDALLEAASIEY